MAWRHALFGWLLPVHDDDSRDSPGNGMQDAPAAPEQVKTVVRIPQCHEVRI